MRFSHLLVAAAALVMGVSWAQPSSASPTKIGIIHIQNAILSTKDGQKAASELEQRRAPKAKEFEKRQSEIAALRDQLNKIGNTASEEAKQKLMREIDQKTKNFNRDLEDAQAEFAQEEQKVLQELGGRLMAVIDKYARDNGFAVILDVSSQQTPVIWASSAIDITQDVVQLYDKNAPSSTSAPAPSGAGGGSSSGATGNPGTMQPKPPTAVKPPSAATPRPGIPAPKPGTPK